MFFQVAKDTAVTDREKREKDIVVKKMAEMEKELKVALYNNLTNFVSNMRNLFGKLCSIFSLIWIFRSLMA